MATFEAQIEGLTSLSIDGSSAPNQTELTQFLTDGAKEIINVLPQDKLEFCSSQQTFTSVMPGSESETLNTGKILRVYRNDGDYDKKCRLIPPELKGYANDPDEMQYASITDPVFYIENNKINALPQGGSCKYDEIQYPSVAYGDSAISAFPDEAEYLVVLYGAVKSLQNVLGSKTSSSTITTALTAVNTELDESKIVADDLHGQVPGMTSTIADAKSEIALANAEIDKMSTETGLDNDELDKATNELSEAATLVDTNIDTAVAAMTTAAGRINTAVLLANDEFDEVSTEVSATATSPISAARSAVPSAISIDDLNITTDLPPSPAINTVSYTDATNSDASATAVITSTATAPNIIDVSGNAPTYTKPTITRVTFKAFFDDTSNANIFGDSDPGEFSFSADLVAPPVPSISIVEYTDASNTDASASAIDTTIMSSSPISYGSSGDADSILDVSAHAPNFTKPSVSLNFAKVTSHLDDNEDVELAQSKINQIQAQIAEYNANIQNEVNEFNKENARYQMEYQEATEKANRDLQVAVNNLNSITKELSQESQQTTDVDKFNKQQDQALDLANKAKQMEKLISDNNNKLQKYSSELQLYQANVNKETQAYQQKLSRYNTELSQVMQAWSKTESDTLQKYSSDIQNELNEYNKDNVRYQMEFQEAVTKSNADLQVAIANANNEAQELRQESTQTTDIDKFNKQQDQILALTNAAKQMENLIADNNSKLQKYSSELQSYQAQVSKDVQEYQQNLQQKLNEFESSIKLQSSYYQEAQARINTGNAYLSEAQASSNEVNAYGAEVAARIQQVQGQIAVAQGFIANGDGYSKVASSYGQAAQGYLGTANAYLQSAQGYVSSAQAYASEIQSKLAISQGYANEVQARLSVDTSYYTWYEKQQAKLQADYDKGLQILIKEGN